MHMQYNTTRITIIKGVWREEGIQLTISPMCEQKLLISAHVLYTNLFLDNYQ